MNHKKGYLFLSANIFFAIIGYFLLDYTYRIFPKISVFEGMFWGFLGASVFLIPFFLHNSFRKKIKIEIQKHSKLLITITILGTIANLLWLYGIKTSTVSFVSLLENTQALFAFLLGVFLLKEVFSIRLLIYFSFVLIGVCSLFSLSNEASFLTSSLVLISAFIFAFQSFCLKKWGAKTDILPFVVVRTIGMLFCLFLLILSFENLTPIPLPAFLLFTIAHIIGVIICRYFFFNAHKYLPISSINLSLLLLPFFTVIIGYFFFNEPMSIQKLIGGGLIMIGMLLFLREKRINYRKLL